MARRKGPSAIGLSMLDLISNSLASVIILFIIISSVRIPSIPPERTKGTLFVRLESQPQNESASSESIVWVEPLNIPEQHGKSRFFGSEIFLLNTKKILGKYSYCGGTIQSSDASRISITPCIAVYSQKDSANVYYLVIRNPVKKVEDKKIYWGVGLLYVDHDGINVKPQPATGKIRAWFIGDESQDSLYMEIFPLDAPTDSKEFILNLDRSIKNN